MTPAALTAPFASVSAADVARVGGKGANLGALMRAGITVPPGFCITTEAFDRFLAGLHGAESHFAKLDAVGRDDTAAAHAVASAMRADLEYVPLPNDVTEAIRSAWHALGTEHPLAVRSSATAEDLPGASFAGQQDTYLNVRGEAALFDAVRRCFVSLFNDRAVLYRARQGFGHRGIRLAVVVQRLIDPEVSGILFTADPVSGHRGIVSIDAGFGLGEALVSGLVDADLYRVDRRRNRVIEAKPGHKPFAIRSVPGGGTRREPLSESMQNARALDDAQVLALAAIGERIEAHYGGVPQDVEWCVAQGTIYIVQARPITSLFPIPAVANGDEGPRVFVSFGHVQMMTDAMPRLVREFWRYFVPAGKGRANTIDEPPRLSAIAFEAGSRLFLETTLALRAPRARTLFLSVIGHVYENVARAMEALTNRPEFRAHGGSDLVVARAAANIVGPVLARVPPQIVFGDPSRRADEAEREFDAIANRARKRILTARGIGARIRRCAIEANGFFTSVRAPLSRVLAGVIAHRLLTRLAQQRWADDVRDEVDRLLRGLPRNVTTEMDLAVGDLTDRVRPYPKLAALLRDCTWSELRTRWNDVEGGTAFAAALDAFLARYGDRATGEVDLSRPRWRDDPSVLLRVVTGGLSASGRPRAHREHHAAQVAEGERAAARLEQAARRGRFGRVRAWVVRRLCRVARSGLGLREHPKFAIVRMLGAIRAQVLEAGETLARRGQIAEPAHIWHLGFDEIVASLDDPTRDLRDEIASREAVFRRDRPLKPPAVISSDGETPTLAVERADLPPGALAGTAASNGVVEGIARVIRDPEREVLHAGEVLIAPFTDPGWTPLFVHAAAVVTEVGGLMTHGAVVAREYGIPAVVSVAGATERIRSGQRVQVDGTRGFVRVLEDH